MDKAKLEKYREERGRYLEKIASYQKRVRALDQKIMEGENLEIRALMKGENVTLEELTALVRQMQERRRDENRQTNPDGAATPEEPAAPAEAPRLSETDQPTHPYEPSYTRPAYAATFSDLEDENE